MRNLALFRSVVSRGCSVSVSRVSRVSRISVSLHRGFVLSPSSTDINFYQLTLSCIHPKSLVYFGFQKLNTLPSALPPANYNEMKTKTTELHCLYT